MLRTETTTKSPDAVIAVFERQPYWGPELQRQFSDASIRVRECRSLSDLPSAVEGFAARLFVIDIQADPPGCLAWLGSLRRDASCDCPIIACGAPDQTELEWILREAGVSAFLCDVIPGDDFARLCRRQLGIVGRIR